MPIPADATVKTEDNKTRVLFAGEDLTVLEALEHGPVPVQFPEPSIPKFTTQWGELKNQNFGTRFFILLSAEPSAYGEKVKVVNAWDPHKARLVRLMLPVDYQLRVLTGRQGKSMRAARLAHMAKNFTSTMNFLALTSGADPEVFVEHKGEILPAFTFLPDKAHPVRDGGPGDEVQAYWDGFQAEWSQSPKGCLVEMTRVIRMGLKAVLDTAQKKYKTATISHRNVVEIPQSVLDKAEDKHVEFGCAPSLNAYGLVGGGGTLDGRRTSMRFSGGHIHFGFQGLSKETILLGVKAMDAVLAVACVPMFQSFDNPVRRQYYGLPGEYRLPPHGVEYRTLSSAWTLHPLAFNLVFDLARMAFRAGISGLMEAWDGSEEETVRAVQDCDVAKARALMERNKDRYKALFTKIYAFQGYEDRILKIFSDGIESVVKDPTDVVGNWQLGKDQPWQYEGSKGMNWSYSRNVILEGGKV